MDYFSVELKRKKDSGSKVIKKNDDTRYSKRRFACGIIKYLLLSREFKIEIQSQVTSSITYSRLKKLIIAGFLLRLSAVISVTLRR